MSIAKRNPRRSTHTLQASISRGARRRTERSEGRRRAHAQARSAVQRDTEPASTAGQRAKREQLQALSELQKQGYATAGKFGRVKTCGTIPIVHGRVALGVTNKGGTQVCGLARCGSRWCPDCWGKVSEHRGNEIREVVRWAENAGHRLVLMTLTAAHVQNSVLAEADGDLVRALAKQDVGKLFDGLTKAWRHVHVGRGGQALKRGRIGYSRAFELTTDAVKAKVKTGVHGHFHVLLVMEESADLDAYRVQFFDRWVKACARYDLTAHESGFDFKVLRVGDAANLDAAASYLVKGEKLSAEKIGHELTRSDVKVTKLRTSPEGLLREIGAMDDQDPDMPRAVASWRGIEEACKGRRWLTWSRDLRKLAGLVEDELTDEEIAVRENDVEDGRLLVVSWEEVREHLEEIRKAVYRARPSRRWETLELCLNALGIDREETTQAEWSDRVKRYMSDQAKNRHR